MNLNITIERENDGRIKIVAEGKADEYGSQVGHTIWTDVDPTPPAFANAIGRAAIGVGLEQPSKPAPPPSALRLTDPVYVPPGATKERSVVVDGDSDAMRTLMNEAIMGGGKVRIDYTSAAGVETTNREIEPVYLDWGSLDGTPTRFIRALDDGVLKTFYLARINRAEAVQ